MSAEAKDEVVATVDAGLKGKRIIVTGGAGFIGSHTVVLLIEAGAIVEIIDNLSNSSRKVIDRIEQITGTRPVLHVADMRDISALDAVFSTKSFDACIHFAGLKAVSESVAQPLAYYENNVTGTLNLLKLLKKHKCTRLVFSSSATVYGMAETVPIEEIAPLGPCTNTYGWTKLMIEQVLRDEAKGADGAMWRIATLRYFNPIGAHGSGLIGEDPKGIPNNLLPYLAQVAIGRLPQISIFGDDYDTPDGTGIRDYIHVVDLARGHLAALLRHVFNADPSTPSVDHFNLGSGIGTSVKELIAAMEKACGRKLDSRIVGRRAGDVAKSYANADKAEKLLHWKTQLSVERAVADTWRWQKSNPSGFAD